MAKRQLWLLVLAGLSGAIAQTDLEGQVFVFPKESADAQVILNMNHNGPLQNFTVCLRYFTDLTRAYSLFSYATRTKDNEILLFKDRPGVLSLVVGGEWVVFKFPENTGSSRGWEHVCASWESATGIAELWVNWNPLPRKGVQKGYSISNQGVIVLGQEQDSFGGGFDASQSFVGELSDVCMWDLVTAMSDVRAASADLQLSPSVLNWGALQYQIKGYVVLKPMLR
uniref:Pentraxin family member n=1 Tax=Pelodiscus sinensis TaxID=13735 RepID=K7FCR6_PELSI|nr:mucosal pentraxin-like isoform X1 [Pelodiscus sinensis]XP_025036573.1 mucosal pentraxin-like isoform X1 [Pelodiscus sinensis]|eukprot:XP_006115303.1 mucosal pentraxin-like isoform X1 [Pelodiscus sinensis]